MAPHFPLSTSLFVDVYSLCSILYPISRTAIKALCTAHTHSNSLPPISVSLLHWIAYVFPIPDYPILSFPALFYPTELHCLCLFTPVLSYSTLSSPTPIGPNVRSGGGYGGWCDARGPGLWRIRPATFDPKTRRCRKAYHTIPHQTTYVERICIQQNSWFWHCQANKGKTLLCCLWYQGTYILCDFYLHVIDLQSSWLVE